MYYVPDGPYRLAVIGEGTSVPHLYSFGDYTPTCSERQRDGIEASTAHIMKLIHAEPSAGEAHRGVPLVPGSTARPPLAPIPIHCAMWKGTRDGTALMFCRLNLPASIDTGIHAVNPTKPTYILHMAHKLWVTGPVYHSALSKRIRTFTAVIRRHWLVKPKPSRTAPSLKLSR